MRPRTRRALLGLATGIVVSALLLGLRGTYVMRALELKTLDARFLALQDPGKADTSIVIVDVDDLSLDLLRPALGRYPWPRDVWAMVVQYLAAAGARAIAFDFTFPDPVLSDTAGDAAFAAATRDGGRVVHTLSFQSVGDTAEVSRLAAFREDSVAQGILPLFSLGVRWTPPDGAVFQVVQHPYRALLQASHALGSINYTPDPVDGTARATPLLYGYRGRTYPSFALAAALVASGRFPLPDSATWSPSELALGDLRVPLLDGMMLVNWHGPYRDPSRRVETYRVFPIAQVLRSYEQVRSGSEPEVPLETFEGKVVFLGATGSGLFEARPNPFGPSDPGVLIHATAADNIINGDFLRRAGTGTNVAAVLLLALVAGVAVSSLASAWASAAAAAALVAGWLAVSFGFFAGGVWVDVSAPSLAILLTFTGGMAVNYVTEGRQKKQIRDMFSKYVAPEYVAQLADDPSQLHLEGRRAELSILFSDIRGFTSISEKLEPAAVIALLNDYLSEMAGIVKASGGTLDKFIGDAVMAFWGEPVRHEDHAVRACECALGMAAATERIAERFAREGRPAIRIGIGINTAEVVVGNIGSMEHKLDYTVIGDGVNLASRLEGLNKEFSTTIIISEYTLAKVDGRYETRPLGEVKVKGKEKPVAIYELRSRVGDS